VNDLTDAEKAAVECLKQEHPVAAGGAAGNEEAQSPLDMLAQIRHMNEHGGQQDGGTGDCMNCNFIGGSTAEVEHLWSVSDNVLRNNRKGVMPQLFEALVCLKVNKRFWGQMEVSLAVANTKTECMELHNQQEAAAAENARVRCCTSWMLQRCCADRWLLQCCCWLDKMLQCCCWLDKTLQCHFWPDKLLQHALHG
jgi:hypothetical protein